jgi:hypothetical protein
MGQPNFSVEYFGTWNYTDSAWSLFLFPALTPGFAFPFTKDMDILHSQVADPATCKGLSSHHKLTSHAVHTLSYSEEFHDFRWFPSSEWNLQLVQMRICYRCEAGLH